VAEVHCVTTRVAPSRPPKWPPYPPPPTDFSEFAQLAVTELEIQSVRALRAARFRQWFAITPGERLKLTLNPCSPAIDVYPPYTGWRAEQCVSAWSHGVVRTQRACARGSADRVTQVARKTSRMACGSQPQNQMSRRGSLRRRPSRAPRSHHNREPGQAATRQPGPPEGARKIARPRPSRWVTAATVRRACARVGRRECRLRT
jgi:hypothetical protein